MADNVTDFPNSGPPPAAPAWLTNEGRELWRALVPVLIERRDLTPTDMPALRHLCGAYGQLVRRAGGGGRPWLETLEDMRQAGAIRDYLVEFNLLDDAGRLAEIWGRGDDEPAAIAALRGLLERAASWCAADTEG